MWATAPYLHDGRAASIGDVLTVENTGDRHGTTSHLSAAQIDDLVAYLRTIDAAEAERAPPARGCSVAARGRPSPLAFIVLAAAVVWRNVRRERR